MTEHQSSRSRELLELGRVGMGYLIREPVRQSVREALAKERALTQDQAERTRRPDDDE